MPKAVVPEDLIDLLVQADRLQRQARGARLSRYPRWRRLWIEPPFNVLGWMLGQAMAMLPWAWRKPLDPWINLKMGGHRPTAYPELPRVQAEAVALARRLQQVTGQWPGMLLLTSHPPTVGPLQWLRFELLRFGLLISHAVVEAGAPGKWFRSYPQCFLAIDPFALDTVSAPIGAFYSGWMYRIYLAWDRQSATQSGLQRYFLLRGSGYPRIFGRLMNRLKRNVPVLMAYGGGLPQNARLLYAAREFVQRLPVQRWPYPKIAAAKKLMETLMQPEGGVWPPETGEIPAGAEQAARALLRELGLSPTQIDPSLENLRQELRQSVPYRTRLVRVLLHRLVRKGKPLLWMAVTHSETPPHIRISTPWACYWDPQRGFQLLRSASGPPQPVADIPSLAQEFSQLF